MRSKLILLVIGVLLCVAPTAEAATPSLRISVLSNRADLVSAGDALVEVVVPQGVRANQVRVFDDGRDVTPAFAPTSSGRLMGLVRGLSLGRNMLSVRAAGAQSATITVTNHLNGGPVFSGPQVKPWVCQSTATDAKCNQPPSYTYQYKSSSTGQLRSYDPSNPPSDVAMTTTDQGVRVPFIIRTETGYQDRDQYKIAVLYDPSKPWTARMPQRQWNHKLLITHGASCGIERQAGSAPSVTGDTVAGSSPSVALGRGFAVMSTALDNAGHNCNIVTQAESLVMAKERLVERYGRIRYTIGTGCSGGSLTQQQVANAYPGIYQGILPQCSFPDAWSTGQQLAAYHLIRTYAEDPSKWGPGVAWTPAEIAAIEGHPNHVNSIVFDSIYWTDLGVPDDGCVGVPADQTYNAQTNPAGVRCTLADYMINVFGRRPQSVWIGAERQLGHGFAGLPLGDVGVQFGLEALKKGQISTEQFVDLNQKIGGVDIDINSIPQRSQADDPALRNAYRSGAINETNNMSGLAIIDLRGPDPGAFHDAYRTWTIRSRLEREQGKFPRNHVIWFGQVPLVGDHEYTTQGLLAMDRWLSAVESDKRSVPLSQKVAEDRPADVRDRCARTDEVELVSVPGIGPVCELKDVQTRYATPAMVAGEGIETDINRCQLKPLRRLDYYPIEFTDEQWARLASAFPTGVCDWAKPGVKQQDTIAWQTYQDAVGKAIYGGTPLGSAPGGSGVGWTSPAFGSWRG
jgi:hypothetical protein